MKNVEMARPAQKLKDLEKQSFVGDQKQNTRTLMQALHGCRKNCRECREEEAEWEPKIEQKEVKRG